MDLVTLSAGLIVLILLGLLVQGARIDEPETLRSLSTGASQRFVSDAVLLGDESVDGEEPKATTKRKKS